MIRVLIFDIDYLNRKRLQLLLNSYSPIFKIYECSDFDKLDNLITSENINLLITDINFNENISMFNFFEKLSNNANFFTIIVSENNSYALKAFEYQILDYIIKPYSDNRFINSIHKFIKTYLALDKQHSSNEVISKTSKIPLKLVNKILFIDSSEIEYIKASSGHLEVYSKNKKYVIRETISKFENILPNIFIRIHRSTIVNIESIKEVVYSNYGDLTVKIESGELLRIGKTYKSDFKNFTKI